MRERRLAQVAITSELLFEMFTQGFEIELVRTTKGLPKDASFVSSYFDEKTMTALLTFEHDSFSLVSPGMVIPILSVEFTKYAELESMRKS
jgi:hypothetical protein